MNTPRHIVIALLLGGLLFGCATTAPSRPSAFTPEWAQEGGPSRRQMEQEESNGRRGDRRAVLYQDEEGRTRVGIRDEGGLGADVDSEGRSPFLRFGYQHRFGGRDRSRPDETPQTGPDD